MERSLKVLCTEDGKVVIQHDVPGMELVLTPEEAAFLAAHLLRVASKWFEAGR